MGLKLTNIQLFVGDNHSPQEVQNRTVEALQDWLSSRDFVPLDLQDAAILEMLEPEELEESETTSTTSENEPIEYPEPEFDRGAAVGFARPNSRWVALYDQFIEDPGRDELTALCAHLSAAVETYVVSTIIFSDSYLQMVLYSAGQQLDFFDNDNEYRKLHDPVLHETRNGHPSLWQSLFMPGVNPQQLRDAWDADFWRATDILQLIYPLLGMDDTTAFNDWRHCCPRELVKIGFRWLAFRSEQPALPRQTGQPLFKGYAADPVTVKVDEGETNFTYLYAKFNNQGGAGNGVRVMLWGSALDNGLLVLESVEVVCWRDGSFKSVNAGLGGRRSVPAQTLTVQLQEEVSLNNIRIWRADVPDFGFEAALALPPGAFHPPYSSLEIMNAQNTADVLVYPKGRMAGVGKGELHVALGALEVSEPLDWMVVTKKLDVQAQPTAPIKVESIFRYGTESVRRLSSEDKLTAVIWLGNAWASNALALKRSLEEWLTAAGVDDNRTTLALVYNPTHKRKVQEYTLPITNLMNEPQWQQVSEELANCEGLSGKIGLETPVSPFDDEQKPRHNQGYGFAYSRHAPYDFQDDAPQNRTPTLLLWKDLHGLEAGHKLGLIEVIRRLVTELMEATTGLQAVIAWWNWIYDPDYYAGHTLYEQVKNIELSGSIAQTVEWNSRWLRAVTEHIWLGESLTAGFESWLNQDRAHTEWLARVAQIEKIGGSCHLSLKTEDASLAELEELLEAAGLVPSVADCEAVNHEYIRQLQARTEHPPQAQPDPTTITEN